MLDKKNFGPLFVRIVGPEWIKIDMNHFMHDRGFNVLFRAIQVLMRKE